jgi:predicted dienelactone hydrolase
MVIFLGVAAALATAGVLQAEARSTDHTRADIRQRDAASTTNSSSATSTTRSPVRTIAPDTAPTRAPTRPLPTGPPWNVARTIVVYTDGSRSTPTRGTERAHAGRVLRTIVRWPITDAGALSPGRHPLVVFAHGYAVETSTYSALLDDLTAAGTIVAAPEFPGESAALPGTPNESDLVNEPCDLEFVAASLEDRPPAALSGALAHAPLVFAGHSDGATAAAWAGYSTNACAGPTPSVVVALSSDDVRVKGAGQGALPALLAATGTDDQINPVANTERLWLHVPRPAWLLTVDGGTHLGTFTTDPDRARVDAVIAAFVLAHTVDPSVARRLVVKGRLHFYRR